MKYTYNGESLKKYCDKNGKLNYSTLLVRIKRLRDRNPNLSDSELVEKAMDYEPISESELEKWCAENKIAYGTIATRVSRLRKEQPSLSKEELLFLAKNKTGRKAKYMYKGKTLKKYLEEERTDLKYSAVDVRIFRIHSKNPIFNPYELVLLALEEKTIEEMLERKIENYFYSKGILYKINPEAVKEYIENDIANYIDENSNPRVYQKNRVKTLIQNYKQSKTK